jgi:predicted DNA-binding transcriptional regulator AlpA
MTLLQFPGRRKNSDGGKAVIQPDRQYLSTEQVARWLGLSGRTITAMAVQFHESAGRDGLPGGFKIGRSWRFDRQQIQTYIESKKVPLQPPARKTAIA